MMLNFNEKYAFLSIQHGTFFTACVKHFHDMCHATHLLTQFSSPGKAAAHGLLTGSGKSSSDETELEAKSKDSTVAVGKPALSPP